MLLTKIFVTILEKLPDDIIKKVIDKGLDVIEENLAKDGLKPWEEAVMALIGWLRKSLDITEEEGSEFAD